ncbi:MAG: tetratricopeptide repeat protein [Gammaproteobacteria bacterium]
MSLTDRLEGLLAAGKENAPLRVSLAQAAMGRGDARDAITHLEQAVKLDPDYTAAWKAYGRALAMEGHDEEARKAYRRGLEVARSAGDRQATREIGVFLRRLDK